MSQKPDESKTADAREIIVAAMRRMARSGESYEMCARWIVEDLRMAGLGVAPVTVEGDIQAP